jgi:hypothetical protein
MDLPGAQVAGLRQVVTQTGHRRSGQRRIWAILSIDMRRCKA